MNARSVRSRLLRWYGSHRRDLPWRRTGDPWAVWVSEVMLQQTRVATVLPYYRRFLERFPDPPSLARAAEEEVLSLWSGLGYYRRARALRAGAARVAEELGGRIPRDPRALRRLPGVGRYTAGAIASMAFGLAEPALDGNVRRVLSRVCAVDARRTGSAAAERRLWSIAGGLVRGPRPGELNQALMELGALVCTPRAPSCRVCPLATHCAAHRQGREEHYPVLPSRRTAGTVDVAVALFLRAGRVLLERPGDDSPLRGTWDVPAVVLDRGKRPRQTIRETLARRHGIEVAVGERVGEAIHGIMNRRLRLEVFRTRLRRGRTTTRGERLRWEQREDLGAVPLSGATPKVLRLAGWWIEVWPQTSERIPPRKL